MKRSSHTTGIVQGMILTYQQHEGETTAEVGSAAWFGWLEQATAFTFHDEAGHFTAHKTRAGNQRGGAYWRATRRRGGRLFSYYLGPSARLSPEHCIRRRIRSRCVVAMTIWWRKPPRRWTTTP